MHLIIDVASVVKILSGERALETRHAHPEGHGIKVDVMGIGLRLRNFLQLGIGVHEQGHIDFNFASSPEPDVLGEGAEANVIGDVAVVDVETLRDGVVEVALLLGVPDSQEGDGGDGQHDFGLRLQHLIFGPDRPNDFGEVALSGVGLRGSHLQHPPPVLQHQGEVEVLVLSAQWLRVQLQRGIGVQLEEVSFNFLAPFDYGFFACFLPLLVLAKHFEKLSDSQLSQEWLQGPRFFGFQNLSQI